MPQPGAHFQALYDPSIRNRLVGVLLGPLPPPPHRADVILAAVLAQFGDGTIAWDERSRKAPDNRLVYQRGELTWVWPRPVVADDLIVSGAALLLRGDEVLVACYDTWPDGLRVRPDHAKLRVQVETLAVHCFV